MQRTMTDLTHFPRRAWLDGAELSRFLADFPGFLVLFRDVFT